MAQAQKSSSLLSMMLVDERALLESPAAAPEAGGTQAAGTAPAAAAPDAVSAADGTHEPGDEAAAAAASDAPCATAGLAAHIQRPKLPAAAAPPPPAPPSQQQAPPAAPSPVAGWTAAAAPAAAAPDDPRRWQADPAPAASQTTALLQHGGLGSPGDAHETRPLLNTSGPLPHRAARIKVEEPSRGDTGAAVPCPRGVHHGCRAPPADAVMTGMDAAWKPVIDADHGRRPREDVASRSRPSSPKRNKCGCALFCCCKLLSSRVENSPDSLFINGAQN